MKDEAPDQPQSDSEAMVLDVWLDFLRQYSPADDAVFERLCVQRPGLAEALRRLRWKGRAAGAAPPVGAEMDTAFQERLQALGKPMARGARFLREGALASGGMGTIHRVRDLELDRTLALKEMILAPASDHALASARFLDEAQVTAQLDHPGIVPVHEVGLNSDGRLYFAMKLVRGRDLRAILDISRERREGWTQPRMLGVMLKVCEAMAYAHTKGVIHRDLKPGNVMVGHFGEVYVMDWGLARAMGRQDVHDIRLKPGDETKSLHTERRDLREETPDSPLVTMDGAVVGTPAYMSPEQARGEIHLLSPRCDVYSIGAMLYHLLTGQTPYVPPGTRLSQHTVLARVIEGPPPPVQELALDVPVELAAICEKAMARAQDERYPDTLALAEDLRAYLEGRVVQAHESGALPEFKKWVGRNKGLAAASAAAILALIGGFAASVSFSVRAGKETNRANAEAEVAARRTAEVLRLSDLQELDDLTAEADVLWPIVPESAEALLHWLERARRLVAAVPAHEAKLSSMQGSVTEGDRWWRNQLTKLIEGVKALDDPETGLIAGLSPKHGWGIERRLEFARSVEEHTLTGPEARARWAEALASIRDDCPWYASVRLAPQLGLLPIGQDRVSGLWEFAHLQTGEPAVRGSDGKLILRNETGLVLVLLPGGTFRMGAQRSDPTRPNYDPQATGNEGPVHTVTLSPFFLSKYEMTQGQWKRITAVNPSRFPGALLPVEQVNWILCDETCRRMGLTLPSEAQWEYGARSGIEAPWWSGEDPALLSEVANLADRSYITGGGAKDQLIEDWDDGASSTATIGRYAPNYFGLHDVHGNVWEWCADWFDAYPARGDVPVDPVLMEPGVAGPQRVSRGGSFEVAATYQRSAYRNDIPTEYFGFNLGLRPARQIVPAR